MVGIKRMNEPLSPLLRRGARGFVGRGLELSPQATIAAELPFHPAPPWFSGRQWRQDRRERRLALRPQAALLRPQPNPLSPRGTSGERVRERGSFIPISGFEGNHSALRTPHSALKRPPFPIGFPLPVC